jgi:predicted metalloprotease with PDZ domain
MHMPRAFIAIVIALLAAARAGAQNPQRHFTEGVDSRFARTMPVVHYLLTVNEGDTTGFNVQMSVRGVRDTFRIALARHPEYDDRFFRYVEDLRSDPSVTITPQDSAVWRVIAPGGEAVIQYRIAVPSEPRPRAAWRPFLARYGALVGGPHSFMYVVGAELAPAHVEVVVPWRNITTGLTPTAMPNTFYAANAYVLVESPIMAGQLRSWTFSVDRVPHTIAYLGRAGGPQFDTTTFRGAIEKVVVEAVKLFGRPPYREYTFQFQDDAFGGLEHHNSVTLGARSALLAPNANALLPETAHEYLHTWNLMRIRPAEYVGVTYKQIQPVPTLWFSEGLTIFYADLLTRRAGLPASTPTRTERLASIIARYLANPGQGRHSAEQISRVAYNAPPDALGDYSASAHLQGEVLGAMLDLMVRDATDGKRSMDDVMRLLHERGDGPKGVGTIDIERAVADVCSCPAKPFFDAHVRGAQPVNFDRYVGLIGLRTAVTSEPVLRDTQPAADLRLFAWNPPGDSLLALQINNPQSLWGKAGLHSGERLITMNGNTVRSLAEFRQALAAFRVGDNVHLVVKAPRALAPRTVTVKVAGYERPVVRLEEVFSASEKQLRLREAWSTGTP